LIATDAAREGLNLQAHCWHLFHFDVPWNPMRLVQRHGRIDRIGSPHPRIFLRTIFPADRLEQLILSEGPDTIAAFFAEPVMGAGGVIVPPATYFERIQPILRKYDVLFVVDEVICGFGRTGRMFGTQTFDLKPDIITVAKALSAGYLPISATLVSTALYDVLVAQSDKLGIFGHGYTYSSHPVSAAVALETLRIYEERDIVTQVARVAPRMQAALRSYADHPLVGDARGLGLIGAVEIVRDKATKQSFDSKAGVAAFLVRRAQQHGVILRNMPGDIVAFCPPLIARASPSSRPITP